VSKLIVSKDVCPPVPFFGEKYVRSKSPWHRDAFPEEFQDSAPEQGERKEGWMLEDHWGNAIGFIPDGTELQPTKSEAQNEKT